MAYLVDRSKDAEAAEAVRVWLATHNIGDMAPVDVSLSRSETGDGEEAWFFEVTLPTPPAGETWPVDALSSADREIRDQAIANGVTWPWYVIFLPDMDEPQEDEDDQLHLSED